MDLLLRLFDLFNETAKKLATYLPQSGDDLLYLLRQLLDLGMRMNEWVVLNIGVNLRIVLSNIGRLVVIWLTFLLDLVRSLVDRI